MTKEEVIKGLKENLCSLCAYGSQNMDSCDIRGCDNRDYIKALEQQPNDCKIFGTKENCFGGATENECEHCDYKIQKLEQHSDDCVSRQAVLETIDACNIDGLKGIFCSYDDGERFKEYIKVLPPVTPTHGTCKDCTNYVVGALDEEICLRGHELIHKDFYCRDFEKRGNENGSN